jgi:hypothetical protein
MLDKLDNLEEILNKLGKTQEGKIKKRKIWIKKDGVDHQAVRISLRRSIRKYMKYKVMEIIGALILFFL